MRCKFVLPINSLCYTRTGLFAFFTAVKAIMNVLTILALLHFVEVWFKLLAYLLGPLVCRGLKSYPAYALSTLQGLELSFRA